jgi:peptidoglycan/LPS O-acetylase OafA/YrhL
MERAREEWLERRQLYQPLHLDTRTTLDVPPTESRRRTVMTDTTLLRALAVLLIANSHLEAFYPFRPLAADGLLGDSLFFFLSGYGLRLSDRARPRSFTDWYARRLTRIYPALLTTVFLFAFLGAGGWRSWRPADYFLQFGWGVDYPFVGQIIVFYALFYGLQRLNAPRAILGLFFALFLIVVPTAALGRGSGDWLFHTFHWVFYFQAMLLGALIADAPWIAAPAQAGTVKMLAGLGALYIGARFGVASDRLQSWFFLPHLIVLPILILLLRTTRSAPVADFLERSPRPARAVGLLGGITLELYLIHYQVLSIERVRTLVFPLNVAVFFGLSILAAWALSVGLGPVYRRLRSSPVPARTPVASPAFRSSVSLTAHATTGATQVSAR